MQIFSVCVHEGNKDMFCCKENLSIYLLVQYPTILPLIANLLFINYKCPFSDFRHPKQKNLKICGKKKSGQ